MEETEYCVFVVLLPPSFVCTYILLFMIPNCSMPSFKQSCCWCPFLENQRPFISSQHLISVLRCSCFFPHHILALYIRAFVQWGTGSDAPDAVFHQSWVLATSKYLTTREVIDSKIQSVGC